MQVLIHSRTMTTWLYLVPPLMGCPSCENPLQGLPSAHRWEVGEGHGRSLGVSPSIPQCCDFTGLKGLHRCAGTMGPGWG